MIPTSWVGNLLPRGILLRGPGDDHVPGRVPQGKEQEAEHAFARPARVVEEDERSPQPASGGIQLEYGSSLYPGGFACFLGLPSGDVVVTGTARGNVFGHNEWTATIGPDGTTKSVVQRAYDDAGALLHEDPKK